MSLIPEDRRMLEKLIGVCRATQVAPDREQAASAARVERLLATLCKKIAPPEKRMAEARISSSCKTV
ncbi:hypothetical protein OPIT5_00845 [Opitutaceae bacterium TAV5]|nr:hypothetical protein OPIT5_00845 [Opitutaceae bacterium TAV5]